ncbi:hypothetical protein D3C81_1794390 [compost metagenome]
MWLFDFFAMDNQAIQCTLDNPRCRLLTKLTAVETQTRIEQQILRTGTTLGILTPATAQRAAFHKDNGADAGAIVGGIALNIENHKSPLCFRA